MIGYPERSIERGVDSSRSCAAAGASHPREPPTPRVLQESSSIHDAGSYTGDARGGVRENPTDRERRRRLGRQNPSLELGILTRRRLGEEEHHSRHEEDPAERGESPGRLHASGNAVRSLLRLREITEPHECRKNTGVRKKKTDALELEEHPEHVHGARSEKRVAHEEHASDDAHCREHHVRGLEARVKTTQEGRQKTVASRGSGDAIRAETPSDDVRDARVEKADSENQHHPTRSRSELLSQDLESVPGAGNDAKALERDREEDSEGAEAVEQRHQRARKDDRARHVALRVLHLVARGAHQLEAENVEDQDRQISDRTVPPWNERLGMQVVRGLFSKSERGEAETSESEKDRRLHERSQIRNPLRDLEANHSNHDRKPGQDEGDPGLKREASRS